MRVGDRIRRRADGATGTIVCVLEAKDYTAAVARLDSGGFISFLGEENCDAEEENGGQEDATR
jgi:hypothetical protein